MGLKLGNSCYCKRWLHHAEACAVSTRVRRKRRCYKKLLPGSKKTSCCPLFLLLMAI